MTYEFKNPVIKIFELGTITAGSTFSGEWDTDDSYVLKYVFVKADGAKTTKSTMTFLINNVPLTKDKCLCNTFGSNPEDALLLNISLAKGVHLEFEGVNNEGADKSFTVELVMERA